MTWRDVEWLSAAADDPAVCRETWANDPRAPYVVPTGRFFDVVTVEQRVGMEALDQLTRRRVPLGPAVLDHRARRVGFFLAPRGRADFARHLALEDGTAPAYRYLSHGSVVVVPGPAPRSGDRQEWLTAPSRRPPADPLAPVALAAVLVAAAELLTHVDRYGENTPPTSAFALAGLKGAMTHAR
ncbi:bifunctional DNA primase/polymerase [Streptomyces sp. NPDC088387]|uniref:bifunctional DNA primase/polymerase n=1 Tax=Streptomyces sp. NPDC088387 TaxID=3365859 RepID=UPI00382225E4